MSKNAENMIFDKIDKTEAKILIVDDIQENINLVQSVLKNHGYKRIWTQNDSTKVIDMVIETEFDLIILDINMPVISGLEILTDLKRIYANAYAPVLMLTANTSKELRMKALKNGAQDFIEKPFDISELVHRATNIITTRILFNSHSLSNEMLELQVRERTRTLNESRKDIIYRLAKMAEYRDNETGDHVIRVSKISGILAKNLGHDYKTVEQIEIVAPMHDVGKVGIPDGILLKPGPLTDEEFKIMKSHTVIGEDILANHPSQVIQVASRVARNHHEKWDGSGYPDQLQGENIPIECRIVCVADVFDALTSNRPYKKAWALEKAILTIEELSGKHFEPEIVKIFKKSIDEIAVIMQKYNQ